MLGAALLSTVLAASPPPVSKALDLVKSQGWEELYLGYAAANAEAYSAGDRKKLGEALAKGCAALEASDAVMAYSMGEKAAELDPSADALLCIGRNGPKAEQASAAEAALKKGELRYPKDARFPLTLARQLLGENDSAGALAALEKVPKKSKERAEADTLKKKALAMASEGRSARAEADSDARAVEKGQAGGPPEKTAKGPTSKTINVGGPGGAPEPTGLGGSYESSTDGEGRRIRANKYFRFRYFNGVRDFGQRADYEGRAQAALEKARAATERLMGETRQSPTDVILYSKEEFTMHHGADKARAIAGFYSENAIRMNDSAEINEHNQVVLVHEYTHAVIDELASFRSDLIPVWIHEGFASWVEWRYQGNDGPPLAQAADIRGYAKEGHTPRLKDLEHQALIKTDNPGLAYGVSGCAVRLLIKRGSVEEMLAMIRDLGKGAKLEVVLKKRFDLGVDRLQEMLDDDLKSR